LPCDREDQFSSVRDGLLTIIIPAFNEEANIADTIESVLRQTRKPDVLLIVDDGSTDRTGEIAGRYRDVTVIRPPRNTGSKAGAQNFALSMVTTEFTMAIDADTVLAEDAIEHIMATMAEPDVAAACGFVTPRYCRTLWERGRFVEYMMSFSFYKRTQDAFGRPLIASGCFSVYRTAILKRVGGWSQRTMTEDLDLTWSFYGLGLKVRFEPAAVAYPIEPPDFHFMRKQLRRWSHGFVQNVMLHWRDVLKDRRLALAAGVVTWDAGMASFAYILVLPLVVLFVSPAYVLAYVIDLPAVLVPSLVEGFARGRVRDVLASLPAYFVLRVVNAWFMLAAFVSEIVLRRRLATYEKGH
jgi:poly-beta-1,6-N-acetyl-D-glucosamine synthase